MKKVKTPNTLILIGIIFLLSFSHHSRATEHSQKASYWVFENNLHNQTYTVVKFYNTKDVVVYEKKIEGKYLSPKKRDIKKLNKEMARFNTQATNLKIKKEK